MEYEDRSGKMHTIPEERSPKYRTSAYGLYVVDGEVMLIQPTWAPGFELPGGGLEFGESETEGLKREFLEETGYEITKVDPEPYHRRVTKFYADDIDEYYENTMLFYHVHSATDTGAKPDPVEVRQMIFLRPEGITPQNTRLLFLPAIARLR